LFSNQKMVAMIKLVMCYPSLEKENVGTDMLFSPLALAYLASHTPSYYEIELYDEYVGSDLDPEMIDADIVAVSSLSSGILRAYEIGDKCRVRGIMTVIGGAHVTSLPEEALEHFDTVITGEGEKPWIQLLKDYEEGHPKRLYNGASNVPLDNVSTPDRQMIHSNYHYPSVMTSRGCPYACSFCYLTIYEDRAYRTIPHDTVLKDLDSLRGNPFIIITDENFIGYNEHDFEDRKLLLHQMIHRDYQMIWGCQASIHIAEQPGLMKLMYQAGCRIVFIGFESSDTESLESINKTHNIGIDYKDVVKKIHQEKIAVIASCILGMDNHRNDYHKQLINELKNINADFVRVFFMTAWPGTPLYEELKKEGRTTKNWDNLRKDVPSTQFKYYSHEEALKARKEILRSFFNWYNLLVVSFRWLFKDRSLLSVFLRITIRFFFAEIIKYKRARNVIHQNNDL